MDLNIEDVADLLNKPTATIKEWVAAGTIPSYKLGDQLRFSRMEIESWMLEHPEFGFSNTSSNQEGAKSGSSQFGLYRSVHLGGVFTEIEGSTKEEVIRNTMLKLAETNEMDSEMITDLLLDRERLMPTALSNGIAVPHTRDSLLNPHRDIVAVAYPKEPLDYGALDGQKVHTLFFLFASSDKRHLHLLAKIAHLSSQEEAVAFLQGRPDKKALLGFLREWESAVPQPV